MDESSGKGRTSKMPDDADDDVDDDVDVDDVRGTLPPCWELGRSDSLRVT